MLKSLMAAAAISAALMSAASAEVKTYYRSGVWSNYGGYGEKGAPMCGMSATNTNSTDLQSVHIKWVDGAIRVFAFKRSWVIPNGTKIPVELGFDGDYFGSATAYGTTEDRGTRLQAGMVNFDIAPDAVDHFLEEVAHANKMWIRFTSGNETPWNTDMTGSRNSVNALKVCISVHLKRRGTQPYGESRNDGGSTQPFGNGGSTQPFGNDGGSTSQPFDSSTPVVPKPVPTVPVVPKPGLNRI
jgi:hypothetical protein